ncbi:MAG TPA: adenylate/guanylate cyclase domain-containing protein [Actinomycetota bacterium]|jgi:class 3 adenylate cyclase|nr:adenylate/guanylate cyclase domain-containing protein [Actinomycetota bacterium]
MPETQYAPLGDSFIAYQVVGQGPPDIVLMRSAFNHVELQWEEPRYARFLSGLGSVGRLIVFDPRGAGLSDPFAQGGVPTFEEWADDVVAVMDAASSDRATLVCIGGATIRGVPFVAAHPERVSSLVICNGYARIVRGGDYPYGLSNDEFDELLARRRAVIEGSVPESWFGDDVLFAHWTSRYRKYSVGPGMSLAILEVLRKADVRHLLSAIAVPTLVIDNHPTGPFNASEHARFIADEITGASFVELPGETVAEWRFPDPDAVVAEIERFVVGSHTPPEPDRVLATVLFTDIVESTRSTVAVGDRRWRAMLDSLDRIVDGAVTRFRGRVIKSTGDGHLATFDGPGRAIRCATLLNAEVEPLGLTLRSGLHTGEVEVRGSDIGGIAVSIARRVCDSATDGQVLVSSSVPPLVAGSQIEFEDRGTHELKGVPGTWQLFEVKS